MKRDMLSDIISRAFIRGITDKAILYFKANDLHCAFVSSDETIDGRIVCENFGAENFIGDGKLGIPDVDDFIKKIDTLSAEITVSVVTEGRNYKVLMLTDGLWTIKHNLIADSQLPKIRKPKAEVLSLTPVTHHISSGFITSFYKMSGSVKDCKYMYVMSNGKSIEYYIAQSDEFLTGVKMQYDLLEQGEPITQMKFNLKSIRTILNKNKTAKGVMKFHPSGLLGIEFESGNLKWNYFITADS